MKLVVFLVLILGAGLLVYPQDHTWIVYFTHDGWTYEYDPVPEGHFGYLRNSKLKDPYANYKVMTRVQYICSDRELKFISQSYFDDRNMFFFEDFFEEYDWMKPTKNSTSDVAMKLWCKYAR